MYKDKDNFMLVDVDYFISKFYDIKITHFFHRK